MIVSPDELRVPLQAFRSPGVFAAVRVWRRGLYCPCCNRDDIIRFGRRPHGSAVIQQFQCRAQCRPGGSMHRFVEYSGTPLAMGTVTAEEWLAIWYWRLSTPTPLRKLQEVSRDLGLAVGTIHHIAYHEQSWRLGRRNAGGSRITDWLDLVWRWSGRRGVRSRRALNGHDVDRFRIKHPGIYPKPPYPYFTRRKPTGRLFEGDRRSPGLEVTVVEGDPIGSGPTARLWAMIR